MRAVPGVVVSCDVASGGTASGRAASSRRIVGVLRRVCALPAGGSRPADDPAVHAVVRLLQLEPTARPSARDAFAFLAPPAFREPAAAGGQVDAGSSEGFPASQSTVAAGGGDGVASSQELATLGCPP
eukprot:3744275-Alexandrium_andersonii.AAC.1